MRSALHQCVAQARPSHESDTSTRIRANASTQKTHLPTQRGCRWLCKHWRLFYLHWPKKLLVEHSQGWRAHVLSTSFSCSGAADGDEAKSSLSDWSSRGGFVPASACGRAAGDSFPTEAAGRGTISALAAAPLKAPPLELALAPVDPLPAALPAALELAEAGPGPLGGSASQRVGSQNPVRFSTAILSKSALESCDALRTKRALLFLSARASLLACASAFAASLAA